MQDRLCRLYVAVNSTGYNTPPQHSKPWQAAKDAKPRGLATNPPE